jgi:hypothetical protein
LKNPSGSSSACSSLREQQSLPGASRIFSNDFFGTDFFILSIISIGAGETPVEMHGFYTTIALNIIKNNPDI